VRADVDQAPVIEDDDPVGALHGGQAVGDDDRRPAAHRRFERRLHDALAGRVEAAGRFVEQQQRRILEIARAMAMRCRWPPERRTPRSPTKVA
jgi:primosomal protein N''